MEGLLVRRAEPGDHRGVTSLISKAGGSAHFRKLYGSYNFGQMIETAYLSVSALSTGSSADSAEVLVGFAVLSDSPRAGDAEAFLAWVTETHAPGDAELKTTNSLWVDFAVALWEGPEEDGDAGKVIENIVRTVFNTLPEVDYLVMSLPGPSDGKDLGTPSFLLSAFEVLIRHTDAAHSNLDDVYGNPTVLFCDRMAFLPTLAVRTACVEDHDDLVPIFEAQSDLLSATYGEFFLADMIEMQDEENKLQNPPSQALAALVQQRACGLMATSSDLEIGLLQECFHLEAYDHLVKIPPDMRPRLMPSSHPQRRISTGESVSSDVSASQVPKVMLLGAPGAGKTTVGKAIAEKYGLVLVSVEGLARERAEAGDEKGQRAMNLLLAGEELLDEMVLALIGVKLAGRECQEKGWVLEGVGTSAVREDLEEAIVMAAEVGMEHQVPTCPDVVIVLNLQDSKEVVRRVQDKLLQMQHATGDDTLSGRDGSRKEEEEPAAASALAPAAGVGGSTTQPVEHDESSDAVVMCRWESYRDHEDFIVRTYADANKGGEGGANGADESEGGDAKYNDDSEGVKEAELAAGVSQLPQEELVPYIAGIGGSLGIVNVIDASMDIKSVQKEAFTVVDSQMAVTDPDTELEEARHRVEKSREDLSRLPSNAFAVTLFCIESCFESRAMDLLPHAFQLYPGRDYCVLTVPSEGAESVLLRHFTPVPARAGSAFSHVFYIMHRDSLPAYKYMRVSRFVRPSHRPGVARLVEDWSGADQIMAAVKDADRHQDQELMDNPPSAAFVATLGHQVVGVLVANREACGGDKIHRLRSEYRTEDFIAFDRHRPRNQATLTAIALSPLFSGHCRFAIKEVMRLYDKTVIYWECAPDADLPAVIPWHMIPVRPRQHMQAQLEERSNVQVEAQSGPSTSRGWQGTRPEAQPSALYTLSRRFITEPKITANRRVVLVGASATALACLEALVFTPYLNFTSITLVSPGGLPSGHPSPLLPTDEDMPDSTKMAKMGLERHVRVVRSRVVDLDRENRAILLPDGSVVPYDALVLCTGLQDNTSRHMGLWSPGLDPSDPGVPGFLSLDTSDLLHKVETSIFTLSSSNIEQESKEACNPRASTGCGHEGNGKIVVFACALKALSAVRGLLDMGVLPQRISIVFAPGGEGIGMGSGTDSRNQLAMRGSLGDPVVDAAVEAALAALGVAEYRKLDLKGIRLDQEGAVEAVLLESYDYFSGKGRQGEHKDEFDSAVKEDGGRGRDGGERAGRKSRKKGERRDDKQPEQVELPCSLILCGATGDVDPDVFQAVNRSGLVYDGRLVVDLSFRTADQAILAGGTLTKFSRVHRRVALPHQWHNSREVGEYLASCVLGEVDPLSRSADSNTGVGRKDSGTTPPPFELPRCVSARLPGGLNYVRATLPETAASSCPRKGNADQEEKGDGASKTFATGSLHLGTVTKHIVGRGQEGKVDGEGEGEDEGGGQARNSPPQDRYCVVRVNALDRVCDIMFCGTGQVEVQNLARIVGVHIGYLQGLENSMERGEVQDLISYFRGDCFTALYHDRFHGLIADLRVELAEGDEAALDLLDSLDRAIKEGADDEWISVTIRKAVGSGGERLPPSTCKTIEARALDWVRRNRALLPRLPLPTPSGGRK